MRLIDADALLETVEDHVTAVSCCPTVDWSMGKTQMKKQVIEDIRNAQTIGGWISVKDRLPDKQPCEYLVVNGNNVETAICLDNRWITPRRVTKITHWMPLPEPPEEVTQDG